MTRRQAEAMSSSPPWPASLSSQVAAFRSWTKEPAADSEHRGALLHGHFQVVGHAHRAHPKVEAIGQSHEGLEPRPSALRRPRGAHGHEPPDVQTQPDEVFNQARHLVLAGTVLLRLAADVDLNEDAGSRRS